MYMLQKLYASGHSNKHTCRCSLVRRHIMLIRVSSSVPKPRIALRKSWASLTGSKFWAATTVGVPYKTRRSVINPYKICMHVQLFCKVNNIGNSDTLNDISPGISNFYKTFVSYSGFLNRIRIIHIRFLREFCMLFVCYNSIGNICQITIANILKKKRKLSQRQGSKQEMCIRNQEMCITDQVFKGKFFQKRFS